MRIAYICVDPGVPVFGCKGSSIHVQELVRAMLGRGARVEMFSTRLGGSRPTDFDAVRIHCLPHSRNSDSAIREQSAIASNDRLRAALERKGPFDVVYERYSLWSFAGMEYARDFGIPGLLEVNAPLIDEQIAHRKLINRNAAQVVAQRVFGSATALIAVSDAIAEYLTSYPINDSRVHVVSNGVNPRRFTKSPSTTRPAETDTFTVGFVGTLKPWHGLATLIQAFRWLYERNSSYRVLIVGDGPEKRRLVADLSAWDNDMKDAVQFKGAVPPDDVPRLLASMDVAVAPYPPTSKFYFSPLKIYEYMAAGLPVIASNVTGLHQLIQNGINGLLCTPGDAVSLAETIDYLRKSPQLMRDMGNVARTTVCRHHSWNAVLQRIFQRAGIEQLLESSCMKSQD